MATQAEQEEQEEAVDEALTVEEIAMKYSNMMESVALMKEINATGDDDDESLAALAANKSYLETERAGDCWTDEDLTEVDALIA